MDSRARRRPHPFVEPVEVRPERADPGPVVHIVLVEPEIPQNTGTIVRLAAATGCPLHLVEPLGFTLDERSVKRAGLDYWQYASVSTYPSYAELPSGRRWLTTKKAERLYTQVEYRPDDYIVFGCETTGLPDELIEQYSESAVRIPMFGPVRSLNLANAVSIVVYEALRQIRGF
jgi:tRNA (cytidine/uridine-2'-O-)-methyltransferase